MPNRIWSEEKKDWIIVDETNIATNVEVMDIKGYYHENKSEETKEDEFLSVEKCLEQIGDKINNGDIGAIGEIKDKVNELDERVTYIEENGGGGGGGSSMPTVKLLSDSYYAIPTDGE